MTEKLFFVISEITWIFVTFIQNHFRNICYLWYTTVTRTLRLFSDVLNFLKFMQLLRIIFNPTEVFDIFLNFWHLFMKSLNCTIDVLSELVMLSLKVWLKIGNLQYLYVHNHLQIVIGNKFMYSWYVFNDIVIFFIMASHVPFG